MYLHEKGGKCDIERFFVALRKCFVGTKRILISASVLLLTCTIYSTPVFAYTVDTFSSATSSITPEPSRSLTSNLFSRLCTLLGGCSDNVASNAALSLASFVELPEEAYFVFGTKDGLDLDLLTMVFKLTDPLRIIEAREILRTKSPKIVIGTVSTTTASTKSTTTSIGIDERKLNRHLSFEYLTPTISFARAAIEVCDASIRSVHEHILDNPRNGFLPNDVWCPWGSELHGEITLSEILRIDNKVPPTAYYKKPYQFDLKAYGGTGEYEWGNDLSSAPPAGLTIEKNGKLTGIPTRRGKFTFSVLVKSGVQAVNRTYTLTVR